MIVAQEIFLPGEVVSEDRLNSEGRKQIGGCLGCPERRSGSYSGEIPRPRIESRQM